ncbi:MAG: hypothetical protein CMJ78_20700 [Planctomycetaceae bacterium]|nr:hypothetical protein [Planctomycetaceae bacterium]
MPTRWFCLLDSWRAVWHSNSWLFQVEEHLPIRGTIRVRRGGCEHKGGHRLARVSIYRDSLNE